MVMKDNDSNVYIKAIERYKTTTKGESTFTIIMVILPQHITNACLSAL